MPWRRPPPPPLPPPLVGGAESFTVYVLTASALIAPLVFFVLSTKAHSSSSDTPKVLMNPWTLRFSDPAAERTYRMTTFINTFRPTLFCLLFLFAVHLPYVATGVSEGGVAFIEWGLPAMVFFHMPVIRLACHFLNDQALGHTIFTISYCTIPWIIGLLAWVIQSSLPGPMEPLSLPEPIGLIAAIFSASCLFSHLAAMPFLQRLLQAFGGMFALAVRTLPWRTLSARTAEGLLLALCGVLTGDLLGYVRR